MSGDQATPAQPGAARALVSVMRIPHWIKNAIVLFPVIFARRMSDPWAWLAAAGAAAAFCLVCSGLYIVNDIRDIASDRYHPRKKDRPIASGRLRPRTAAIAAMILLAAGLALSAAGGLGVLVAVVAYAALMLGYSFGLKHKMLLDVIIIALGFVLRAAAGALAIRVEVSGWLIVCTFTICLFLGFCKRYAEMVAVGDDRQARRHRPTLAGYTRELLTHLITMAGTVAVIAFLMYSTSPRTVQAFKTPLLAFTLPLVVYAIFRFAMLSMRGRYADPTDLILHDRPFQLVMVLWTLMAAVMVTCGQQIASWLPVAF